jgi:hypothetical protein
MPGFRIPTPIASLLCCGAVMSAGCLAHAQVAAHQAFRVRVPTRLRVTTPAPTVTVVHDGTMWEDVATTQRWSVKANARWGATVSFTTDHAFARKGNRAIRRDARLDLNVVPSQGPTHWAVTIHSDQTDYRGAVPDERATVRAISERPGSAAFDVTVTLLDDPDQPLEPGEYSLTVLGTITAN